MPSTITPFDTTRHHIYIKAFAINPQTQAQHKFNCVLDTGAPKTEFADFVLFQAGFISSNDANISIKAGLQTQKYGKVILPNISVCGRTFTNFEVIISRFEQSWGVAALIGLDFFRQYKVTVDYASGHLITEPLAQCH